MRPQREGGRGESLKEYLKEYLKDYLKVLISYFYLMVSIPYRSSLRLIREPLKGWGPLNDEHH